MLYKIKNRVEESLKEYVNNSDKLHFMRRLSPYLYSNIKGFILRKGKRIRPILFVIGYLGFAKRSTRGLYMSAVSLELLHDFALIHDDIVDRSDLRRGLPSMHKMLDRRIATGWHERLNGEELAIIAGDILYAMAISAFLAIDEDRARKENALNLLTQSAVYTGSGEFVELLNRIKRIGKVSAEEIYRIYDLKTAYYTFSSPLAIGAMLAGAERDEVDKLFKYGRYLGRAFQIRDDILSLPDDLRESKKTIMLWHLHRQASGKDRPRIERILNKEGLKKSEIVDIERRMRDLGSIDYSLGEIASLLKRARVLNGALGMDYRYKKILNDYAEELLKIPPLFRPSGLLRAS